MAEKDKNYVSAVVYIGDEKGCAAPFLEMLTSQLENRFGHYELVLVEDASRDGTEQEVRDFLSAMEKAPPITMIHMSLKQGLEMAMNAGLDMAVGDFVYEFDSMKMPYPAETILQAYDTCLQGNDIVAVSPEKNRNSGATLFYKLFNSASRSKYPLHTDAYRLLSRRAINRVHSISPNMPYRKAAYAASGLKMATITYSGSAAGCTEHLRISRAVGSLALYTDIAYRTSAGIAIFMLVLMVAALVYILVMLFGPIVDPVPGWATTMLMMTGGFFGVFLILAIVMKYLSLLVDLIFRRQTYLIESVEKIK